MAALSPERAYFAVVVTCLVGVVVVLPLSRPPTAGPEAAAALAVIGALCLLLAASHRLPDSERVHLARGIVLFFVGLLTGVPGWFFGTFSGFSAVVTLGAMLAGIVSGSSRVRRPDLPGWMTYAGLALGQALAFALPFSRVVGDRSLVPVFFYYRSPRSNQVVSHLAIQAVLLVAFLGARTFQRRYMRLAAEVQQAERASAVRDALLTEARAEYMRALVIGRRGADAPAGPAPRPAAIPDADATVLDQATTRIVGPSSPTTDWSDSAPRPADSGPSLVTERPTERAAEIRWADAYRSKMRGQYATVVGLAIFGCIVVPSIAHHRAQVYVAWISIALIVATASLHRLLADLRKSEAIYWPWAIIAALGVGPTYAFGLHSSFAAVIAVLLFLGGLFRAKHRASGADRRIVVLAALCGAQAALFVLVFRGVIPDLGNVPVRVEGSAPLEPVVQHLLLQGVYVASFVAGWLVDRRYEELVVRGAEAARDEARQEEALATTRAAIDRLEEEQGDGIFANHRVGRFELRRLCARGGMGDVYEATEVGTDRRAAVKLVRYEYAADPVTLGLLITEAAALRRIRSPHVAEVLDAGGLDQDLPYVAMEFIDGPPLSKVLRERRRLALPELRALVRDVAAGLEAIHLAGVVHRDVKPQNIMRTGADASAPWKLVDLGVAQAHDPHAWASTNVIIGTPQYMAPEQAFGEPVDARADLYSLCLVVYRALTGRPALIGRDHLSVARTLRAGGPPSPRWFVAITEDIEYVLRIGLATRPDDRFASAAILASAYEDAFTGTLADTHRHHARMLLRREPWTNPSQPSREEAVPGRT